MNDHEKSREELLDELAALRLRVAAIEVSDAALREAEAEIRLGEEKYRMLIEACPDAVVVADLQMRIVFASSQAVRLYGANSAADICGQFLVDFVAEEQRQQAVAVTKELFQIGLRHDIQYTFLRQNGQRFPVEVSTAVVKDPAGRPKAIISIVRDISERVRAEESRQREHCSLKHLLESSDHERQLIAYEIHDGLAQDLAGAIMQFQVFEQFKDRDPTAATKGYHSGIALLRQSHFEARRLIAGVRPPILDESGVVEAIAHLVHEQGGTARPEIELRCDVHFDRLHATLENAIYRITQEGLANACQHSQSAAIRISLLQWCDSIRIDIRDWGVGFDAKRIHGNRFGLKGIRERCRLLGGTCHIRSVPGKGTRVRVELPLATD